MQYGFRQAEEVIVSELLKASKALQESVFRDCNLPLRTKRSVYKAVVLGTLLYGSEMRTWTAKRMWLGGWMHQGVPAN